MRIKRDALTLELTQIRFTVRVIWVGLRPQSPMLQRKLRTPSCVQLSAQQDSRTV